MAQKILLGISGGIAAYKAAFLVRLLRDQGAEVRVVMTPAAQAFITPLTLHALSGHPVHTELLLPDAESGMDHIELARWAQQILIAPATADCIAKLAHGFADNLLTTICLASTASLWIAPAMNAIMWHHPATQANLSLLRTRKVNILEPESGLQACGEEGTGRMLEPTNIVAALLPSNPAPAIPQYLAGVRILLTAGPTREPIDPVRYLSNRSTGRMGYSLAVALQELGAQICLISGPVTLAVPLGVEPVLVETAVEMAQAVEQRVATCQLFIACAAVADYRIVAPSVEKLKKGEDNFSLSLVKNPDILAQVAARTSPPFTVGFAAETQDVAQYAMHKLHHKHLCMIAANTVGSGIGFEAEDNALLVLWPGGGQATLPKQPKLQLARQLAQIIAERYKLWRELGGTEQYYAHCRSQNS